MLMKKNPAMVSSTQISNSDKFFLPKIYFHFLQEIGNVLLKEG